MIINKINIFIGKPFFLLMSICMIFLFCMNSVYAQNSAPVVKRPPLDGKGLYIHCARCHKATGIGGPSYGGYAANLRETFLDHEQLVEVIRDGRRTLGMPEFKSRLSKREINALATFIEKEFKGKPLEE
jgi:mono/diheme cytochrome c family protein